MVAQAPGDIGSTRFRLIEREVRGFFCGDTLQSAQPGLPGGCIFWRPPESISLFVLLSHFVQTVLTQMYLKGVHAAQNIKLHHYDTLFTSRRILHMITSITRFNVQGLSALIKDDHCKCCWVENSLQRLYASWTACHAYR
jgi:hypothetical protein